MELTTSLSLIKKEFEYFSELPESMKEIIKKDELTVYLKNKIQDKEKEIDTFISVIFDEVK